MSYRAPLLLASLSLLLLAACGGTVANDGNGGSTSSTGSTTGTTGTVGTGASTSTGTTGTGASTSTGTTGTGATTTTGTSGVGGSSTTGTGASTTTGTSGTGGGGACSGYVDLVVGNGAPVHLTSDCASEGWNPTMFMTANGYLEEGGAPPGISNLSVYGCATGVAGSKGLSFSAPNVSGPGSSTSGCATYSDGQGADWSSGTFDLTVTKLGAKGDTIEGTLTASVTHPPSQIAQSITATFKVCHIADELVP